MRHRWIVAPLLVLAACLAGCVAALAVRPAPANAHPLGNFTVNQYAGVLVSPSGVDIDYVVHMAELPAFQTLKSDVDSDADGAVTGTEASAYTVSACAKVVAASAVLVGGRPADLRTLSSALAFPPGTGGLDTLRLECRLRATVRIDAETDVQYRGQAYADRIGWQEITATGDRISLLRSSVPTASASQRLKDYPSDAQLRSHQVLRATLRVRPQGAAMSIPDSDAELARASTSERTASDRGVDVLTARFTEIVGRQELSIGAGLLGLLLALGLGAAHSLAPGHGKSVMAAYLVGERGSGRAALVVALTVAATHTAGVLVLGVVLATSLEFAPQRLYNVLGLASGVLLAAVGIAMVRRARRGISHHHGAAHHRPAHHHGGHLHEHAHDPGHPHTRGRPRLRGLVAMGFAGGLTPSPSAVVVLLGAAALGRAWFGVLLVAAYGVGMAATLTGLGIALARWRNQLERRVRSPRATSLWRLVPVATSLLIVVVGIGLVTSATISLT